MKKIVFALASAAAWAAVAPAYAATPDYAFDKTGAAPDQVVSDMQGCASQASKVRSAGAAPVLATSLAGGLVAGVAVGVMQGVRHAHDVSAAADMCMLSLGYSRLPLTPEESQAMRAARGSDAKKAWIRAFVAQDQSTRIAAAAARSTLLPQLAPEPFAIEGVRLDPATLKLGEGALPNYRPLVTGQMSHRRTATLVNDVEGRGAVRMRLRGGTVLYAVDGNGTSSAEQTTLWCGPAQAVIFGHERASAACAFNTDDGGALIPAGLGEWMMAPQDVPAQIRPGPITSGELALTPLDGDKIGPMALELEALDIEQDHVMLRATASREGRKVTIWTGQYPFDASGKAVMPFWSKRLVMTRSYDKSGDRYLVSLALTEDGAGEGWIDQRSASETAQDAAPPRPVASTGQ